VSRTRVDSLHELMERARREGVLFRNRTDLDSASLVVGKKVYLWRTDWNSDRYKGLIDVCIKFNLDADLETLSPSLVAKKFCAQVLQIPPIPRGISKLPKKYCEDRKYWHYLYYKRGAYSYSWELDIKSAYMSYLLSNPSPYYYPRLGYREKPLLRSCLAELMKEIPKPFRLMLFGFWSSNIITGEKWEGTPTSGRWMKFTIPKVFSAPIFNACHLAMKDLYEDMNSVKTSLGTACVRCHTDSFLITPEIERKQLISAFYPLMERRIKVAIRGVGESILYDVNNGLIAGRRAMHPYLEALINKVAKPPVHTLKEIDNPIGNEDIEELLNLLNC